MCLFKSNTYKGTLKIPLTFWAKIAQTVTIAHIILSNPFPCANVTSFCSYQETIGPIRQEHACTGRAQVEESPWQVPPKWKTYVHNHAKRSIAGCLSLLWNNRHSSRLRHNQEARTRLQVLPGEPWLHFCRGPKALLEEVPGLHTQSVHQRTVRKNCTGLTGECSAPLTFYIMRSIGEAPGMIVSPIPSVPWNSGKDTGVYRAHSFLNNWRRGRSTADTHANAERMRAKTIALRLFKDL